MIARRLIGDITATFADCQALDREKSRDIAASSSHPQAFYREQFRYITARSSDSQALNRGRSRCNQALLRELSRDITLGFPPVFLSSSAALRVVH